MATVDINGTLIDFPDDLPTEQLQQAVASAAKQMGGQAKQKSFLGKAYETLSIPENEAEKVYQYLL